MTSDAVAADPLLPGLRAPGNRVSRRAISYWTARAVVSGAVVLLAEVVLAAMSGFPAAWRAAIFATAALAGVHAIVMPRWRYSVHRWEVTDQALYTRSGWFSVHWRIAPISPIPTLRSHPSGREKNFGPAHPTA